jgi:hypothetical protein
MAAAVMAVAAAHAAHRRNGGIFHKANRGLPRARKVLEGCGMFLFIVIPLIEHAFTTDAFSRNFQELRALIKKYDNDKSGGVERPGADKMYKRLQ